MGIAKSIMKAKVHMYLGKKILLNNIDIVKQTVYRRSLDFDPCAGRVYKDMIDERIDELKIDGKALLVAESFVDEYIDNKMV